MLIDWFTVAAQAINFLLLVWLLKRFLYRPILAAIDEREKRIAAQLQEAEQKKAEALKEQTDFQHKNEELAAQSSALMLEATKAAKTERDKLMESARRDEGELRAKLQKSAYGELDQLNGKIGALAQREVFSIARKMLADLGGASLEEEITKAFTQRLLDPKTQEKDGMKAALQGPGPAVVRSAFDLTATQKTAVQDAVQQLLGKGTGTEFETKPELISGIELSANGRKIAWSVADYLTSLTSSVTELLQPKAESAKEAVAHAA